MCTGQSKVPRAGRPRDTWAVLRKIISAHLVAMLALTRGFSLASRTSSGRRCCVCQALLEAEAFE